MFVSLFEIKTSATEGPQERAVGGKTVFPFPFWYLLEVSGLSVCNRRAHASLLPRRL